MEETIRANNEEQLTAEELNEKSRIMERVENAIDEYLLDLRKATDGRKTLPNITQMEELLKNLRQKTQNSYLDSASDFISNFPENDLIEAKKENS